MPCLGPASIRQRTVAAVGSRASGEVAAHHGDHFLDEGGYGKTLWLADDELTPLANGLFRPANEEYSPERVSFDTIVEGKAQRMVFSGVDFYRTGESSP